MRKQMFLPLAVVASVSLMATVAFAYEDGTYSASAMGMDGEVPVEVTIEGGAITDVQVDVSGETPGIGAEIGDQVVAQILEAQSGDIEGVSGATITSDAVRKAVADALAQADGGADEAAGEEAQTEEAGVKELTTELLVIGGGTSGMPAAITASQRGVETILIEKNAFLGGAGSMSGGAVLVTGTQIQQEEGVTDDTPELMIEDFLANGDNMNNIEMLTMYAENITDTVEWLMADLGLEFQEGLSYQAEYQKDRVLYPVGAATGLTEVLINGLENTDALTMLETRATELITEDGKVIGAKAEGSDGTQYEIYADAVLLATGGYGYAKDLLPEALQSILYYGPTFSTGDGQKMAMAVDAQFDLFDLGKIYPNGIEVAEGFAKSTIWANAAAFDVSGLIINKEGQRIANEKASNNDLTEVLMQQPDQIMYLFMDQASFDGFYERAPETGVSQESIDEYLEANGSSVPLFAHADTIEEVCEIAGIDAAGLNETIAHYNEMVEAGEDADFGRPAQFMNAPVGEGPYYIVEQKPRFATTMGGVVLNENMQVTNEDGEVIEGLYACGEMANLVHGSNSPVGANVSWALTSGHLAGNSIADALGH